IAWWYSNNLQVVWLGLVGLGTMFYFLPKLTKRELSSQYLAALVFWMLMLFGSWGGIPNSAPLPAWMPTLSAAATLLTIVPILAVGMSVFEMCSRRGNEAEPGGESKSASLPRRLQDLPSLRFLCFGVAAFILAGLMNVFGSLLHV